MIEYLGPKPVFNIVLMQGKYQVLRRNKGSDDWHVETEQVWGDGKNRGRLQLKRDSYEEAVEYVKSEIVKWKQEYGYESIKLLGVDDEIN